LQEISFWKDQKLPCIKDNVEIGNKNKKRNSDRMKMGKAFTSLNRKKKNE